METEKRDRMTEKRYFKREWEEEYYIFDSYTISEKEFDEKVEYEDYQAFADSMTGEEVIDRLNKYNKEYLDCHNDVLRLEKENDELKQQLRTKYIVNKQYEELQRVKQENRELKKENKQLKQLIKKTLETTPIEHTLAIELKNSVRELYD